MTDSPRNTDPDSTRIIAAHQATFLPWLGWFDKALRADVLILLDDVQWPREGSGNWMNRVRVLVGGEPHWITAPVRRSGVQRVDEVLFDEAQPWREKILRTLEHNYRRAPAYDATFPLVEELVRNPEPHVAAYNDANARRLLDALALEAELVRSSALPTEAEGTQRLIELTRAAGGSVYMSGDGAEGYLDEGSFARSSVELRFQEFAHPRYEQGREFVAGLSIVDALFRCGVDGTRALLLGG
jgi:hypothetical protein